MKRAVMKAIGMPMKPKKKAIKDSGTFQGKSNTLGHGGRAAQLKARGVPGGVIGNLARAAQAAPGQKNFHGKKAKKATKMSGAQMMAMKKVKKLSPIAKKGMKSLSKDDKLSKKAFGLS